MMPPRQSSGSMTLFLLFYYNNATPTGLFNKPRRGDMFIDLTIKKHH